MTKQSFLPTLNTDNQDPWESPQGKIRYTYIHPEWTKEQIQKALIQAGILKAQDEEEIPCG